MEEHEDVLETDNTEADVVKRNISDEKFSGRSSAVLGRGRKVRTPQGAVGGNASPP